MCLLFCFRLRIGGFFGRREHGNEQDQKDRTQKKKDPCIDQFLHMKNQDLCFGTQNLSLRNMFLITYEKKFEICTKK